MDMKKIYGSFLIVSLLLVTSMTLFGVAEKSAKKAMIIPIEGTIDKALPFFVKRGIVKAERAKSDFIILNINTLGGDVEAALLIRDAMVDSKIKTFAYINRAVSAGALIALSTDQMWMQRGAVIGAAQPFMLGASSEDNESPVPKGKLISYVSGEFRSTARRKGHNEDIAQAFVDPDYGLKGLQEKGRPLTLTDDIAMREKFVSGVCENFDEFVDKIGCSPSGIQTAVLTGAEKFARFISNPMYAWIFLLIGILGLVIEFKTPGFGGGGLVGGIALVLFFWGNHIAQMANWLEIILFFIGLGLLALEIFVIPGFGLAGFSGIGLIFLSIFLAMFRMPPSGFSIGAWRLLAPLATLAVSLALGTLSMALLVRFLPETSLWRNMALQTEESSKKGHVASVDLSFAIGRTGIAESVLRPAGIVRIDGARLDAISQGGYIETGTKIKVLRIEGGSVVVESCNEQA